MRSVSPGLSARIVSGLCSEPPRPTLIFASGQFPFANTITSPGEADRKAPAKAATFGTEISLAHRLEQLTTKIPSMIFFIFSPLVTIDATFLKFQ